MKSDIELLFYYLSHNDFNSFNKNLTQDLVNAVYVDTLIDYDYAGASRFPVLRKEIQHKLLIFHAMLRQSYEAFELLLRLNADLLLQETFERFDYRKGGYNTKPDILKTDIAIICISNSKDIRFIQPTFDHICLNGLYENRIFIDFMIRHLNDVNREKFNPSFLKIDVGTPLPFCFDTVEKYQEFLIESEVDITGLYFTKSDYLAHFTDSSKFVDERFMIHAIRVCNFTMDEIKVIYECPHLVNFRELIETWFPELNPYFVQDLEEILVQAETKKPSPKRARGEGSEESFTVKRPNVPPPSAQVIAITSVHRQDFNHLTRRIAALEQQEEKLRKEIKELAEKRDAEKRKKGGGNKSVVVKRKNNPTTQLDNVLKSLKDCRARLCENPCYSEKQAEQDNDLPEDPSPDL